MIFGFEKLEVWQNSIELAINIYKLTKEFPKIELYSLTDQFRRASSSIPANIAEGNSRKSGKEKVYFLNIAYSSLMETLNHLILAERLEYIQPERAKEIRKDIETIAKQLNALRKYQQFRDLK